MESVRKLFIQGQYQKIFDLSIENRAYLRESDSLYLIGASAFLGRLSETEAFVKLYFQSLPAEIRKACIFFQGIALVRSSKYAEAEKIFGELFENARQDPSPWNQYFAYQGRGFVMFYKGDFSEALLSADKSLEVSLQLPSPFLRALSYDLLGHCLDEIGENHRGLKSLQQAHALALKLKNTSLAHAIEISILLGQVRGGLLGSTAPEVLENRIKLLKTQDSYSRANLLLERAKVLIENGRFKEAELDLNLATPLIFESNNRRQELTLHIRFGEMHFQRGEEIQARNSIRSGRRCLIQMMDRSYELELLKLEKKIKGELKTDVKKSEIESSGVFTALFDALNIRRGDDTLILDFSPNSLTALSRDGIVHEKNSLTRLSRAFLMCLSSGPQTKEYLIQNVWGYEYDSLRHDTLVYATARQIRKSLGALAQWLEPTEEGYALKAKIVILKPILPSADESDANESARVRPAMTSSPMKTDLNYRQNQALQYLTENPFINVKVYQSLFKTSTLTASRDLSNLKEKGYLMRLGHARLTRYLLNPKMNATVEAPV